MVNSTGVPYNTPALQPALLRAGRIEVALAGTQMQADTAALLLFPRVERHLLDQLWHRQPAHFRRPAVALDRFFGELGRQLRRFFMLQRFFSALGVATSTLVSSTTVVAFQR